MTTLLPNDALEVLEDRDVYRLYRSSYIAHQQELLVQECRKIHEKFQAAFPSANSTASTTVAEMAKYKIHDGYSLYNAFSFAAPSIAFMRVYRDLTEAIRAFVPERELYMQAWLNYQDPSEVLGWHSHEGYQYHGYIAIDPHDTTTEFEGYEIHNRPGQIYIGRAFLRHRVVNRSAYAGKRITLGFDIIEPQALTIRNRGFIPVLL